jgi:hypothetical protein
VASRHASFVRDISYSIARGFGQDYDGYRELEVKIRCFPED